MGEHETLDVAVRMMRDLDVGQPPICGDDGRLKGVLTDRDIVTTTVADGGDTQTTTAGDLAKGKPVTIGADASVEDAIAAMASNRVRRLPVIEDHKLVGMISQADIARVLPTRARG